MEFVFFIFGAVFGSFFNVCIYRLPRKMSIILRRSFCPNCTHSIRWYDNVPILSWIFLGGRCRDCKEKIPIRYPLVELITGFVFLYFGILYGISLNCLIWLFFFCLLILIAFIDIETFYVLDKIVYPGIIVGIALSLTIWETIDHILGFSLGIGLIGLIARLSLFFLKKEGMGEGDIWIAGLIGIFLGLKLTLSTLLISSTLGIIIGGGLIALGKKKRGDYIPFGTYLSAGAFISFVFKNKIDAFFG